MVYRNLSIDTGKNIAKMNGSRYTLMSTTMASAPRILIIRATGLIWIKKDINVHISAPMIRMVETSPEI